MGNQANLAPGEKSMKLESAILGAVLLAGAAFVSGESKNLGQIVECDGLQLEAAGGVDGNGQHKYRFAGNCKLLQKGVVDGKPRTTWLHTFPASLSAVWKPDTHEFVEVLELIAPLDYGGKHYSGKVDNRYGCTGDPVIAPGSTCAGKGQVNSTGLDALTNAYLTHRPLLAGATTKSAAAAKGALDAPDKAPGDKPKASVPPPKKQPPGLKSAEDSGVAPHVTIRAPKRNEVVSGSRLRLDVAAPESLIQKFGLDGVDLEWQWAPASVRLPGRAGNWQTKNVLPHLKWTGNEGHIFIAAANLPLTRFADATRWRVRASALPAVRPTEWVEFSAVPFEP
jgi:hypothetical protein